MATAQRELTPEERETILQNIDKCTTELTKGCRTAKHIAEKLRRRHITGVMGKGKACPIRNWLFDCVQWPKGTKTSASKCLTVSNLQFRLQWGLDTPIAFGNLEVEVPRVISRFIEDFDEEKFPFLVKKKGKK